ncbi:hypothetical protein BLOT_001642 [Blomia tropicalis]|nr:hypothetical protein BLOT_001642 [Blomia tropicalis]
MTNRTFRGRREQSCSNGNSNLARCTLTVTSILTAFIILLCGQSNQLGFQPRLITRFCYNSPNLSTINSQCVLCNYYVFDATLLGCTGSTALNVNITASQAFCVISQCLGQHHMRICVQSTDPSRLPSQCVYCKTRLFPLTVRMCTANRYLPARMTVNEAFCLMATCRRQLPRMPPEPFPTTGQVLPIPGPNTNVFVNNNGNSIEGGGGGSSMNDEPNPDGENYEETAESQSMAEQPTRIRPPAKFFIGKPQKVQKPSKLRPFLFG